MSSSDPRSLVPRPVETFGVRFEAAWVRVQVYVSSMSIRYKIAGALIAVLCLAIASLGTVSFKHQKAALREELQRRAELLGRQLAATGKTGLLTRDDLVVYGTIRELQRTPDVVYAMVLDNKGRVFAHTNPRQKGSTPSSPADLAAAASAGALYQEASLGKQPVLDAALPIVSRFRGRELRVGTARVALSEAGLMRAIRRQQLALVSITSLYVVLGLVISFALGRILTRQIVVLMTVMKVVAEGNLSRLVPVHTGDEIGKLTETFNMMILGLREKIHMERYLSASTRHFIKHLGDSERLSLGGDRRHVTVLFSDIRGFTAMTESVKPEVALRLLNLYLNLQAEVIYHHGGTIDKFVGDEVMALFTDKDAEFRAVLAAREILNFIAALNDARRRSGKRCVSVGIGLNRGEVIMGNMGSERQMDFTAIGDPINVAARICSSAEPGQAVLNVAVAAAVGDRCLLRPLEPLVVKGKRDPLRIHELVEAAGARPSMRRKINRLAYCRFRGAEGVRSLSVIELGAEGCLLESPTPIEPGTEITLEISLEPSGALREMIHAVARGSQPREGWHETELGFDGLEGPSRDLITEWVHSLDTVAALPAAAAKPAV